MKQQRKFISLLKLPYAEHLKILSLTSVCVFEEFGVSLVMKWWWLSFSREEKVTIAGRLLLGNISKSGNTLEVINKGKVWITSL